MARRKFKLRQLSIFCFPDDINMYWVLFKEIVDKLHSEGFNSIDENWWRSRYYDTIICPNHTRNKKGFLFEEQASKAWKFIWNENYTYITQKAIKNNI